MPVRVVPDTTEGSPELSAMSDTASSAARIAAITASGRVGSALVNAEASASIAARLARSPNAWPPIPSAMANTGEVARKLSSFTRRTAPRSVCPE